MNGLLCSGNVQRSVGLRDALADEAPRQREDRLEGAETWMAQRSESVSVADLYAEIVKLEKRSRRWSLLGCDVVSSLQESLSIPDVPWSIVILRICRMESMSRNTPCTPIVVLLHRQELSRQQEERDDLLPQHLGGLEALGEELGLCDELIVRDLEATRPFAAPRYFVYMRKFHHTEKCCS